MISPMRSANATTAPMTMPAIAPPDKPSFEFEACPVADAEADDADVDVEVGAEVEKVIKAVMVGSTTPTHLVSAFEL
jgi:hypothetical protein